MRFNVYAIRDVHTGFMSPTVELNDAVAKRNFEHAIMNSGSLMNSHPEHFGLYCIGEYESDNADIIACMPRLIVDASEVI